MPGYTYMDYGIRETLKAVLRIRDVYPGTRIRNFFHPGSEFFHPGSKSKNLSILSQKIVSKLSEYDPSCSRIQIMII
jgi:hypothetical protein